MVERFRNIKLSKTVRRITQIALCLALALLTLSSVTFKQQAVVKELQIQLKNSAGEHLIDPSYLNNVVVSKYGSDLRDVPVEFIDIQAVEELYNRDPFVRKAEVCMNKNRVLEILIEERQPIMRIIGSESNYYLDGDGVEVPLAEKYSARLPVIHLPNTSDQWLTAKRKSDLVDVILTFQSNYFMDALVDQLELSMKGEYTIIPLLGKEKIKMGTSDDLDDKIKRIELFYKNKISKGHWDQCTYIDVRFKGQIICDKNKT